MKEIIVASLVGAVIGYFTNWLAIKMLFRPHNEIRVFGMRLPFTPGLIPKERYSIAKKVGAAVSEHLMTTDVLTGAVYAEETTKNFSSLMDNFIGELKTSHMTLGGAFVELAGWDEEKLRSKVNLIAGSLTNNVLKNEKLRSELSLSLSERILDFFKNDGLVNAFHGLRESASGKRLGEYLAENDLEAIKKLIRDKTPGLMLKIRDYTTYDFNFGLRLKLIVHKVIDENVGGFTGLFINRDKVFNSIRDGLDNYLGDNESQTALSELLIGQLDRILDEDVGGLIQKLPDGILEGMSAGICESDGFDDRVEDLVTKTLNSILGDDFAVFMTGIIKKFLTDTVDMEICVLVAKIEERNLFDIKKYALRFFDYLIKKCSHYVFDSINFNALIENQINSFEVSEAEEIILSVVNRELNAITYLGGVLGFIIGLVSTAL